ncbi:hypothetical protein HJG60_010541 [Phyllostomus discolor]|uniref:Uncharacterized protein n=1 Tax=Phyllostomus discolor TaxID=89673 RepID=A0A834EF53_9CHIR|nr:hypothetical protein HJG60_010541 [Phyllostomus discolor]
MAEVAAAAGQGAAVVVVARRSLCRQRRRYQTLPCSERLREDSVAKPGRSRRNQYARRGAFASHTLHFIAGATCETQATNHGPGSPPSGDERGRKSASGGRHSAAAAAGVNRLMNGGALLCGGGGEKPKELRVDSG